MDCKSTSIAYAQTNHFSGIITDYIRHSALLQPFYTHPVSLQGIEAAIAEKQASSVDRNLLVAELERQYSSIATTDIVKYNIKSLLSDSTFTITTAHQPNIFTGYLYFIYKILHTIRLSQTLKEKFPEKNFVPVFYMGSEDADLDELGKIFLNGEKISWDTNQKGAVGRMHTKGLGQLINRIEGEIMVQPHGAALVALLKECYTNDADIQTATFRLINALFAEYGLLVLNADNPNLKRKMIPVFKDDLLHQAASGIVEQTIDQLSKHYKVQANPREINLFYLKDDIRERIIKIGNEWKVTGTDIRFSEAELLLELDTHPERFSPNVILRGLYQETLLPNIAFIGGGGEIAYWLELKGLFAYYKVPFPVLVVRNSFLLIEKKWKDRLDKLQFQLTDLFKEENLLMDELVKRSSSEQLSLSNELNQLQAVYQQIKKLAAKTDPTLAAHTEYLETKALHRLQQLEKKMLKAEKRKFEASRQQIHAVKQALFPQNNLQERVDNFIPYYAKWGKTFIQELLAASLSLEQEFTILTLDQAVSC